MPRQNDPYATTRNADGSESAGFRGYETRSSNRPPNQKQVEGYASGEMAGPLDPAATEFNNAVASRKPYYEALNKRIDYLKTQGIDPNSMAGRLILKDEKKIDKAIADRDTMATALRGRSVVDDETWQTYLGLGYDEADLRQKFIPKGEEKLVQQLGDMYWNAPMFQKKTPLLPDQGARALVTQQVLAPYLQKLGDDFKNLQGGLRQTNNALLGQMDPTYRPFMEAINNNMYASQDQSWIDTLNNVAMAPMMDQFNNLLAQNLAAQQKASQGGGGIFDTILEQELNKNK